MTRSWSKQPRTVGAGLELSTATRHHLGKLDVRATLNRVAGTFIPSPTEAWEYAVLEGDRHPLARLNDLDVEGWHVVNVLSYDAGRHNRFAAIVRRAIDPFPAPRPPEGWYPDPSERHEVRYWNGETWTHNVGSEGKLGRDAPTRRKPTPGLVQQ